MVFVVFRTILTAAYKPTNITGGPTNCSDKLWFIFFVQLNCSGKLNHKLNLSYPLFNLWVTYDRRSSPAHFVSLLRRRSRGASNPKHLCFWGRPEDSAYGTGRGIPGSNEWSNICFLPTNIWRKAGGNMQRWFQDVSTNVYLCCRETRLGVSSPKMPSDSLLKLNRS